MSDNEISYFPDPDNVERVPARQRGRYKWIDKETGKQTYPAFIKRAERDTIYPDELDEKSKRPTDEDEELLRLVRNWLHIHSIDVSDAIETDDMIAAIMELKEVGRYSAYPLLYELWKAGLVRREGVIHGASGRPMYQLWYIN